MHKHLAKIKELYNKGGNIIEYLNNISDESQNSSLDIAISYDLQAGSYIQKAIDNPEYEDERSSVYSAIINQLGSCKTVIEAGVGEGTTLGRLVQKLHGNVFVAGFDISFSRIKYAKSFLKKIDVNNSDMYVGDLFNTPFDSNSIDIVYSNHTLEPNGGREEQALRELYRIAKKYIVLFEPIYELANNFAKNHMDKHRYIRNLYSTAIELGYKVIEYKLIFGNNLHSHNNTGVIIIEKLDKDINLNESADIKLACPITNKRLEYIRNHYYCRESMLLYPVINNIPCLLPNNAIIATHYLDEI